MARPYWFRFVEEYRFRQAGGSDTAGLHGESEDDHDLRLAGEGGWRDETDRYCARASLALWIDADGSTSGAPTGLASIRDDDLRLDIYSAFAEVHNVRWLGELRLGRQAAAYGTPVTFDGLHLRLRPLPLLSLFAFGGRTAHFFEAGGESFDDWMASAGLSVLPVEGLRLEVDYRFTMEDIGLRSGWVDHSYGGTVWYNPLPWLNLKLNGRGLHDEFSHVGLHARLEFERIHLGARLGADSQLVTLRELNERDNPFFRILGESLPHTRWEAAVWKDFPAGRAGTWSLELGWNGRAVHGDEEAFNRNGGRLYLLLTAADLGVEGPFVQLAVEDHFATLSPSFDEEGVITAGGAAGYQDRRLRVEAGSWYQRFRYDYYRDAREVEDVRTVFTAVSWKALEWLQVRARYELDLLEDRNLHALLISLTQSL
ncbi:MAG: hypothetical protein FJ098_10020 [Deltaproteobacteria bacterium]|nr:hypothetical protein [Deltaproteobacteria bacterium]